jgi:hypothetical protein
VLDFAQAQPRANGTASIRSARLSSMRSSPDKKLRPTPGPPDCWPGLLFISFIRLLLFVMLPILSASLLMPSDEGEEQIDCFTKLIFERDELEISFE